jgi:D-sedoheptulose 7-phosphate isomerase
MPDTFDLSRVTEAINESVSVKSALAEQCADDILRIGALLSQVAGDDGLIMLCGNGGSAADSQHIAAELVVRLRSTVDRDAIGAMALTVDTSIITAGGNDYGFENIVEAANEEDIHTIGLLGGDGGALKDLVDDAVIVPSTNTARIQECHILIGHIWCEMIEESLLD